MAKSKRVLLVGVFAHPALADGAVHELRRVGFRGGLVEVVARDGDQPGEVTAKGPTAGKATGPKAKARRKRADAATGSDPGEIVGAAAAVTELIPGVGPKLSADLVTGVLGDHPSGRPARRPGGADRDGVRGGGRPLLRPADGGRRGVGGGPGRHASPPGRLDPPPLRGRRGPPRLLTAGSGRNARRTAPSSELDAARGLAMEGLGTHVQRLRGVRQADPDLSHRRRNRYDQPPLKRSDNTCFPPGTE
jgi:hypothetical protein